MEPNLTSILAGGISGGIITLVTNYFILKTKNKHSKDTWNKDFAVSYSKLLYEKPEIAKQLARQYAVAMIIAEYPKGVYLKYYVPHMCKVSVGRMNDNDIVLIDEKISRDHGVFYFIGDKLYYKDLTSKNSSYLNGVEIDGSCKLKNNDIIGVGDAQLKFIQF